MVSVDQMTPDGQSPRGLPACWRSKLAVEFAAPYFADLQSFVETERAKALVFPPANEVFSAFKLTPLEKVRVVILGQDPYHGDGQAHGLSFSVGPGVNVPPSLRNIFKELESDLGISKPRSGSLQSWAEQGVLLMNTVLTVRAHEANSHRNHGWERFTDSVIECVNGRPAVAFVLWGRPAQRKSSNIDDRHLVLESAHPSPLSAHRGFFGSKPFSKINTFLERNNQATIDWKLE